jgi:dolichol-phosphate mannosyltransferase
MTLPGEQQWQVPEHAVQCFGPRAHDHALVIPVINEGERIRAQLVRTAAAGLPVDVIVADGGSTDGSLDPEFLRSSGVRALLTKTGPGQLSAQLRVAYAWCLREGYAGIVTIDGNGKDNVGAVAQFVEKLREGYGYVQGSRYRRGGKAENTPLERTIGNRMIHAPLLSLAARRWFTDTTNGFRGYSAAYLLDPHVQPFRDLFSRYELLFYLTARASRLGFRTCEIPVQRAYPRGQATPTKIAGVRGKLAIIGQLLRVVAGAFDPSGAGSQNSARGK